jgi:hypothetical protein
MRRGVNQGQYVHIDIDFYQWIVFYSSKYRTQTHPTLNKLCWFHLPCKLCLRTQRAIWVSASNLIYLTVLNAIQTYRFHLPYTNDIIIGPYFSPRGRFRTSGTSDKHLPPVHTCHLVRTLHLHTYWTLVHFPPTVSKREPTQKDHQCHWESKNCWFWRLV